MSQNNLSTILHYDNHADPLMALSGIISALPHNFSEMALSAEQIELLKTGMQYAEKLLVYSDQQLRGLKALADIKEEFFEQTTSLKMMAEEFCDSAQAVLSRSNDLEIMKDKRSIITQLPPHQMLNFFAHIYLLCLPALSSGIVTRFDTKNFRLGIGTGKVLLELVGNDPVITRMLREMQDVLDSNNLAEDMPLEH